jgi:tetratricopeptide (TPR) repeat protein
VSEQARADRYVYVPHIGLFVALVWSAAGLANRLRLPVLLQTGLAAGSLLVLTTAASLQVGHWRSSETLWKHALEVTTENHFAHLCLGLFYVQRFGDKGDAEVLTQAQHQYEQAVRLQPRFAKYRLRLGAVLLDQGKLQEAAEQMEEAVRAEPDFPRAWYSLAMVRRWQERYREAVPLFHMVLQFDLEVADSRAELGLSLWRLNRREEARREWEKALEINPNQPVARNGQGLVQLARGEYQKAADSFAEAIRLQPALSRAWSNCGLALSRQEQWAEARQFQAKAVELEEQRLQKLPGFPRTDLACYHSRLGLVLHRMGLKDEAAKEYQEATRLDPDWCKKNVEQAWLLATAPAEAERDATTAWELATQACQATEPSAEALDALAASLAALGRFPEAVQTAREALARAAPDRASGIKARIARYEKGQAFIAPDL